MSLKLLNVILPPTSRIRFKHPIHVLKTTCSFCKQNDKKPLQPISEELTDWYFLFPIYCCDECSGDGKLTYLIEMMETIRHLENFYIWIYFDGHPIVNPSDVYIPILGSSGNLQFLCMNKKCSMVIRNSGSTETSLFRESKIHGCVIDPQSGEINESSVSIAQIILGVNLLNRILNHELECSYIQLFIGEFDSRYSDFQIIDAIQQSPSEEYVGPRIDDFSLGNPISILRLFSLIISGIYPDSTIKDFLSGEMKEGFLEFITDSMISMTTFMKENGFNDCFPELKERRPIQDFIVKNYGRKELSFNEHDVICQNFRNFLKLFRKILCYLSYADESPRSIELLQYCRFLYATIHLSNQLIYRRFTRQISLDKFHPYSEYLKRYVMSGSQLCIKMFAMIPPSETELDKCAICQSDHSASVIGRCPQHNLCCSDCFSRVAQLLKCPTCRKPDFLP
jgi:hypothetical protein